MQNRGQDIDIAIQQDNNIDDTLYSFICIRPHYTASEWQIENGSNSYSGELRR